LYIGTAFIVFKKPQHVHTVLQLFDESIFGWIKRNIGKICKCCGSEVGSYIFERAPEPTDVYWENLKVSNASRFYYICKTYFYTLLLIGVCFGVTYGLNELKDDLTARQ